MLRYDDHVEFQLNADDATSAIEIENDTRTGNAAVSKDFSFAPPHVA